ncbi:hypothetical protein [Runella zeae]|uniref:hypothetical protein n=1 Tax=Runella zeae TaxID=94255 RepID=UPI002355A86C|nr:hypothetical protein [Runella zeae]
MIDITNDKAEIISFLSTTIKKIRNNFGNPKSIGFYCKPSEGAFTISFNIKSEIKEKYTNSIEFEYKDIEFLFMKHWKKECEQEKSQWKYFEEDGIFEASGPQKLYNINRYLSHVFWTIIRESTREINLPTTLLSFEFEELNHIILHSNLEKFGRIITKLFRDEIFKHYLEERTQYTNPDFIQSIQQNSPYMYETYIAHKSYFYSSLTNDQIENLDKIILGIIDSIAFNVMRGLDENDDVESGISLIVDNRDVRQLPLIGNGNLSGEYLDWVERFSKYGGFKS